MQQHINFYNPAFRYRYDFFSGKANHSVVILIVCALVAYDSWYGYENYQIRHHLANLQESRTDTESLFNQLNNNKSTDISVKMTQMDHLTGSVVAQKEWIEKIQQHIDQHQHGFSAYFAALAKRHMPGLWLTQVSFSKNEGGIFIFGITQSTDILSQYLHQLTQEPLLKGSQFRTLNIKINPDKKQNNYEFVLSSDFIPNNQGS